MSSAAKDTKPSLSVRMLDGVEKIGNKLPEPFTLFLALFLITGVVSTAMAMAGVSVEVPGKEGPETIAIKGLFTGEGLAWFTTMLGDNYIGFPPLVTVLPILLAVGVAEKTGMLAAMVRVAFGSSPRWLLPYAVGLVGVTGSIMADSAFVVIPPLAALVFKAAGRHPVAGLLGGFAAVGAGYSTALVPTSLDALFAGITTSVMNSLPGQDYAAVNPVSNYWFNIASSIALALVCGFIISRVLEPQLERTNSPREMVDEDTDDGNQLSQYLKPAEKKALIASLIFGAILTVIMVWAVMIPNSPWRNEDGGFLPKSPLLSSIAFIVFVYFIGMGAVYGVVVKTITKMADIVDMMGKALIDMIGFLVLAFILGQFIALFNWTGIGSWIAVTGAEGLKAANMTGFPVVIGFILLASVLNLFIISGSSMWTIMAGVFVPMFALIGLEPAFIQAAFRVGDSATQVITPLNPYMIVILGLLRRYEPEAGIGTLVSRMLPFVIPFWITWAALLAVWYFFDLPLGPGNGIFLPM